jgi:hypothetical protein
LGSFIVFFISDKIVRPINQVANAIATSSRQIAATVEEQDHTAIQQSAAVNHCAKTKLSGDGCPLVLTLNPGSDTQAYQAMRDMTENLLTGNAVYQNSEGKLATSQFSPSSPEIDFNSFFWSEEDRIAGSNSAK